MTGRTPLRYRFGAIVSLAGAALFATSGVVAADTETGQHGHYVFKDDGSIYGATCVYSGSGPYKLIQIVVKPPSLWWPDTNSSNNKEHGNVGWQLSVQISKPGASGPWNTLFMNPGEVKTAHEDRPPFDNADKAKLATWTLFINGGYKHKPNAHARIVHEAFWYNGDGSTMGTVTHDQLNYKVQGVPGWTAVTTACPIHIVP